MSTSKLKKGQVIVLSVLSLVVACVVIAGGSMVGAYSQWHQSDKIAPHYLVQGEDIGGLTTEVAKQRLEDRFGRLFVTVHAPDRDFRLALHQLGGELQFDYAVQQARKYGRDASIFSNLWHFWFAASREKREVLPLRWNDQKLRRTMWTVAGIYNQKPADAYLNVRNGAVQVVEEQRGRTLDVPEAIETIQQKYFPGLPQVTVSAQTQEPTIRSADLQGQDVLLGEYTTRFNPGVVGRSANVRLSSQAVEGKVLMPGDTFSFNKATGERTPSKGYRVAKIFIKKPDKEKSEIVDGVGGGVCQVSSTLYNAVRKTNDTSSDRLKIVERNHHSLPVNYVPAGLDATVAWPYKDFRFRNNYSFPIYLRTKVNGGRLTISVWGRIPDSDVAQYTVKVEKDTNNG